MTQGAREDVAEVGQGEGTSHFVDRLCDAVRRRKTPVLVGLDPRRDQLPDVLREQAVDAASTAGAYTTFCREIVDVVAPLVAIVKPQAAFFEQLGPPGMQALAEVIRYAQEQGLLVLLDAKRGDIGSTAEAYADAYVGRDSMWGADALTINPYLGEDTLTPFIQASQTRGGGLFVLVKTSNPGSGFMQDLEVEKVPIYRHVAQAVERLASETAGDCGYGDVGAVVGATYRQQLAELRAAMPHTWFLVPGFGSQGGGPADVAPAFDENGLGAIINSSRGIIFAYARQEFAQFGQARWQAAVEAATGQMIASLASETSAGQLM